MALNFAEDLYLKMALSELAYLSMEMAQQFAMWRVLE